MTTEQTYRQLQAELKAIRTNPAEHGIHDEDFLVALDQLALNTKRSILLSYYEQAVELATRSEVEEHAATGTEVEMRDEQLAGPRVDVASQVVVLACHAILLFLEACEAAYYGGQWWGQQWLQYRPAIGRWVGVTALFAAVLILPPRV